LVFVRQFIGLSDRPVIIEDDFGRLFLVDGSGSDYMEKGFKNQLVISVFPVN
jgi:hypothetical protein